MNYRETLQSVDTEKALSLIGIEFESQGAYAKFACPQPDCGGKAAIKEYGDKKNLYYCPKCKSSGHIIHNPPPNFARGSFPFFQRCFF